MQKREAYRQVASKSLSVVKVEGFVGEFFWRGSTSPTQLSAGMEDALTPWEWVVLLATAVEA